MYRGEGVGSPARRLGWITDLCSGLATDCFRFVQIGPLKH
jgi:hypothetical protein